MFSKTKFQEANQRSIRKKSPERDLILWPEGLMYYADGLDPMLCIDVMYKSKND